MNGDQNRLGASVPSLGKLRTVLTAEELLEALRVARRSMPQAKSRSTGALDQVGASADAEKPAKRRRKSEGHLDPNLPQTNGGNAEALADPAIAIGLAIRLARMARLQRTTLPLPVARSLRQAGQEGDAASRVVQDWADRIGILPSATAEVEAVNTADCATCKTGGDHD